MNPRTLYDKIWDDHLVDQQPDGTALLYIDRHLVHEVTSPQAFEGLRLASRRVRAPEKTLAVVDHNVPTTDRRFGIDDPESALQVETLAQNARDFGIEYYSELDRRQGIVHIVGPEQGFTLPGMTIVCGDSHTSTHGAFGALAHGIGTSEVEHVLATQTLIQRKAKEHARGRGRKASGGRDREGCNPRDHRRDRHGRRTGSVIEYAGEVIRALSMEGRMTVCNMSIEGGARAGMIAPDETTYAYVQGKPRAPRGAAWDAARRYWESLPQRRRRYSRPRGAAGRRVNLPAPSSPGVPRRRTSSPCRRGSRSRPDPGREQARLKVARASVYGPDSGHPDDDIKLDRIFIGSCTNGRMEDLRRRAKVVPGSSRQREPERHGRARLGAGQGTGGSRRARSRLQAGGI
jgi:3-isopropylmalate/(R)-2-methylmalate dehydratase large subunit